MHRSIMIYKQKQSKTVPNKYFDVRDNGGWTFSLKKVLLWIIDCILARNCVLKLKGLNDGFVSYKKTQFYESLTDGPEWCGLLRSFNQLFGLSF